ncbi:MAG: hypothetical protein BroJett014_15240 [Planctomycetota bacterium]|nr:MAG: hypothetical protein BroJett014_15240 [Planctomycetota bacterium]
MPGFSVAVGITGGQRLPIKLQRACGMWRGGGRLRRGDAPRQNKERGNKEVAHKRKRGADLGPSV